MSGGYGGGSGYGADSSGIIYIGPPKLDLHGYFVNEALQEVGEFLDYYYEYEHEKPQLIIITGKGLHSPGGQPVLKPEVKKYLDKRGYDYKEGRRNTGQLIVRNNRSNVNMGDWPKPVYPRYHSGTQRTDYIPKFQMRAGRRLDGNGRPVITSASGYAQPPVYPRYHGNGRPVITSASGYAQPQTNTDPSDFDIVFLWVWQYLTDLIVAAVKMVFAVFCLLLQIVQIVILRHMASLTQQRGSIENERETLTKEILSCSCMMRLSKLKKEWPVLEEKRVVRTSNGKIQFLSWSELPIIWNAIKRIFVLFLFCSIFICLLCLRNRSTTHYSH